MDPLEVFVAICEKESFCDFGKTSKSEAPCKTCLLDDGYKFFKASSGMAAQEQMISESCREATKRWKSAEKEAKIQGDKERQSTIHKILADYLANIQSNRVVTLPDPKNATVFELGEFFLTLKGQLGRSR